MSIKRFVKMPIVWVCTTIYVFAYSNFLYANNVLDNDCMIEVSQPNINYGVVSREQIKILPNGEGELSSRQVVVKLTCPTEIKPNIKIQDLSSVGQSEFKYGQRSLLQVSLADFRVDGQSTIATVVRNHVNQAATLLKPNDEIQPQSAMTGKNIELVLNLTPRLAELELTSSAFLSQSGQLSFNFSTLPASPLIVSSELRAIACTPSVSNGGKVDYNIIMASHLSETGVTVLPPQAVNFSILCDAKTNVAIRARSNRLLSTTNADNENNIGSAQANSDVLAAGFGKNQPMGLPNVTKAFVAGLGISNGKKLGGYSLNLPFTHIKLDGQPVTVKYWTPTLPVSTSSWYKETELQGNGGSLFTGMASYFSYGIDASSVEPSPFKQLEGLLVIQAFITNKVNLDLSSPLSLDGSSTIELYYY